MANPYREKYNGEKERIYHDSGYSLRNKLGILMWETAGNLVPIFAMKYAMTGFSNRGMLYETLSWGTAIALNFSPMLFRNGAPLHLYGGYAGMHIGNLRASVHRRKKPEYFHDKQEGELEAIAQTSLIKNKGKQAA